MSISNNRLAIISNHLSHVPKYTWFKPDGWGFKDTKFEVLPDGCVTLTGSRYENSGKKFPHFISWIKQYGLDIDSKTSPKINLSIDDPKINQEFVSKLKSFCLHLTQDPEERIFHSHGHTLQEMHTLKFGKFDRTVDVVAYPGSQMDVEGIMKLASVHNVLLVPFGGGTNVTHSLSLDPEEERMICSVDMSKMNHVLSVNLNSMTATVEAGISGKDLEKELSKFGVCCGHEPDSVEFSTLGGWISTRASGMKKNVYGNIEDIVVNIRIVTPIGVWERPCFAPRVSTGPDSLNIIIGHEGLFGIITQATIKVKMIPEAQEFDSIIFPDFEIGAKFMQECGVKQMRPASIRLMDNDQFKFGMALKTEDSSFADRIVDWIKKYYLLSIKGFNPDKLCVCTLVFEGTKEKIAAEKKAILDIAGRFRGIRAGSENGKRGYFLTFTIAYIRDLGMEYHLLAESYEASVPWENLTEFLRRVPEVVREASVKRGIKNKVYVSQRITQVYDTGCCIYTYFGFVAKDLGDPVKVYSEIEEIARTEILNCGGSLSHHHGVGKLRKGFMKTAVGETGLSVLRGLQLTIDPKGIMANNNLI